MATTGLPLGKATCANLPPSSLVRVSPRARSTSWVAIFVYSFRGFLYPVFERGRYAPGPAVCASGGMMRAVVCAATGDRLVFFVGRCGMHPVALRSLSAAAVLLDTFVDAGRTSGRTVRQVFQRIPHSGHCRVNMAHIRLRPCELAPGSWLVGGGGTSPVQPQPPVSNRQVNIFSLHSLCTSKPPSRTSHGL